MSTVALRRDESNGLESDVRAQKILAALALYRGPCVALKHGGSADVAPDSVAPGLPQPPVMLSSRSVLLAALLTPPDPAGATPSSPPPQEPRRWRGSAEMVLNPERGFRDEVHPDLDGNFPTGTFETMARFNLSVAQTYYYLPTAGGIPNATLGPRVLKGVSTALSAMRAAGVKAKWRFAYDRCDAGPIGENNYTSETILSHMKQLKATFNDQIDAVYSLANGFVGCWGEWHGARLLPDVFGPARPSVQEFMRYPTPPHPKPGPLRSHSLANHPLLTSIRLRGAGTSCLSSCRRTGRSLSASRLSSSTSRWSVRIAPRLRLPDSAAPALGWIHCQARRWRLASPLWPTTRRTPP